MRSGRLDEAEPDVRRFKALAERQMGDAAEAGDIAFGGEVDVPADTDANVRPPAVLAGLHPAKIKVELTAALLQGLLGGSDGTHSISVQHSAIDVQKQLPLLLAMEHMLGGHQHNWCMSIHCVARTHCCHELLYLA